MRRAIALAAVWLVGVAFATAVPMTAPVPSLPDVFRPPAQLRPVEPPKRAAASTFELHQPPEVRVPKVMDARSAGVDDTEASASAPSARMVFTVSARIPSFVRVVAEEGAGGLRVAWSTNGDAELVPVVLQEGAAIALHRPGVWTRLESEPADGLAQILPRNR